MPIIHGKKERFEKYVGGRYTKVVHCWEQKSAHMMCLKHNTIDLLQSFSLFSSICYLLVELLLNKS